MPELTSLFTPSLLQMQSNQSDYSSEITPITSTPLQNLHSGSFTLSSLTSLVLESCLKLGGLLFTLSTAKTLALLKELKIQDCPSLIHIIEAHTDQKEKIGEDDHGFQSDIPMFSSLKTLHISRCNSLQYVLPTSSIGGLKKLEDININETPNLEYLFGQSNNFENPSCDQHVQVELPVLKELKLNDISNMISICPDNYFTSEGIRCRDFITTKSEESSKEGKLKAEETKGRRGRKLRGLWSCLKREEDFKQQKIKISNSESLRPIESSQCLSKQSQGLNVPIMSNVREIVLKGIDKVNYIFTLSNTSMMMLEILRIEKCHGLKHRIDIGDDCDRQNWDDVFPNLKQLSVHNCEQLEHIFYQSPLNDPNYKEIYVHFPTLEKLSLENLPELISIFPTNSLCLTWPSLRTFELHECPNFMKASISDLMVSSNSRKPVTTTSKDIREIQKHFLTLKTLNIRNNNKLETIFRNHGHQTIGQEVISLELEELELESLPKMTSISEGLEFSFSFQNLHTLEIKGCEKLKVIFPKSVLRCLPELKWLVISECKELEQIVGDKVSSQPCFFPKIEMLIIQQCHKLKCFFISADSTCNHFLNLEFLVIMGASELEDLIRFEPNVKFPKLKVLVFMHLSSLSQGGTELETVQHRLIRDCPNLSLTNSSRNYFHWICDQDVSYKGKKEGKLSKLIGHSDLDSSVESSPERDPQSQTVSRSEFPSSQIEGKSENELTEKIPSSAVAATITSKDSKLIETPSPSSLEIPQHETHSHNDEDIVKDSLQEEAISEEAMKVTLSTDVEGSSLVDAVAAHTDARDESMLPQDYQVVVAHSESASSHSEPLESQHRSDPHSIENREKESIQEGPTFEKDRMKTLSTGLESLSLVGIAPNHNEFNGGEILAQDSQVVEEDNKPNEEGSNLKNKEGGIGVISNDSNKIHQASDRSQSSIIVKLGECKHFVDLDDAQIALLAEAISVYPQLWNLCKKFSGRFQAWMLKTLADMLLFLRNESVISVTPQRLKDFHRLCDEAAQFGFERSWIDKMHQRVMDKDPEVDSAQAQISELLQRHDQLAQELLVIKGEINRLNDFVAARKKCFDFL